MAGLPRLLIAGVCWFVGYPLALIPHEWRRDRDGHPLAAGVPQRMGRGGVAFALVWTSGTVAGGDVRTPHSTSATFDLRDDRREPLDGGQVVQGFDHAIQIERDVLVHDDVAEAGQSFQ